MLKCANSVKKFLVSEDGPTAVEYAVMLALIIVVCLVVMINTNLAKEAEKIIYNETFLDFFFHLLYYRDI